MDLDSEQLKSISYDDAFGIPQKRTMATNVGLHPVYHSALQRSSALYTSTPYLHLPASPPLIQQAANALTCRNSPANTLPQPWAFLRLNPSLLHQQSANCRQWPEPVVHSSGNQQQQSSRFFPRLSRLSPLCLSASPVTAYQSIGYCPSRPLVSSQDSGVLCGSVALSPSHRLCRTDTATPVTSRQLAALPVSRTQEHRLSTPLRTQPGSKMPQNVPHQILQSPARLGLPTPNSPSVQNPPSPKVSSQVSQSYPRQQANLSNTTFTSLTLLSLLPPLSRAQSLLIQMASLASRLFEVSPNRNQWVSAFRGALPSFLPSQLQASQPAPPDPCPSSTKEILSLFNSLQSQLFEAVAELQEILDLQDAKQRLSREIRSKDSAILAFAHKLKDAERVLDMLVDDYSDYCRPKRAKSEDNPMDSSLTTVATQLKLSDILSYAHRISYSTFAPPEFGAGTAPLRGALPPAPQEEQMRASQLYNFADHDVGLPKTDEGKEKIIEPLIEPPIAQPMEVNHLPNLSSIQGLFPSNIVVPSGWKPGMPVELPTDLPLPPPGWKPGDPIPLPPLDSLSLPPKVEEPPIRPLPPPGLPKMPETIQVRHVQLDIDDDSSDYSSEGASSESED